MKRGREDAFARRFIRPQPDPVRTDVEGEAWVERVCGPCGAITLDYPSATSVECFDCAQAKNPFAHLSKVGLSKEAAGEDSKNEQRIREGTDKINLGLPGVHTVVGTRSSYDKNLDGKPQLDYRPITHNELSTNRKVREYAKAHGLTPLEKNPKVAI